MKLLVLFALVALSVAAPIDAFRTWSARHGKIYTTTQEALRFQVWLQNLEEVEKLNSLGEATYGMSPFADMTHEEFAAMLLRPIALPKNVTRSKAVKLADAPADYDWRSSPTGKQRVGAVKNQGSCGSCWAFSTIVHLENVWARSPEHAFVQLSEQQLVDCDHECDDPADKNTCDNGCNGGIMSNALKYSLQKGAASMAAYPYTGRDGTCKDGTVAKTASFNGQVDILGKDEKNIRDTCYAEGPLSVAVDADIGWQLYMGGIVDRTTCSSDEAKMDHGVAIVGWGKDAASGKDFWIIRNSWGASWGEKGHIRLVFGKNMCGVANQVTRLK